MRALTQPALRITGAAALLSAVALCVPACKQKAESGDAGKGADAPSAGTKADAHKDEVKLTPEAVEHYGIRVETARRHVLRETVTCAARVTFNMGAVAHVGTPLRGRVVELPVRTGEEVVKGAPLLVVESPELGEAQSDFLLKKSAAVAAEPAVDLAGSALERARKLNQESQGISLTEVQKRETEFRAAQANLQAARAAATAAENRLRLLGMDEAAREALAGTGQVAPRLTIRSPLAGQVIESEPTMGELVSPDKEALVVVADLSTLWVIADVPESRMGAIAKGAKAMVSLGAGGGEALEGSVTYLSPAVSAGTRTGQVRIEVKDAHAPLKPGMFAQAEIEVAGGKTEAVLAIPEIAVQTVEGETAVFVPVPGEANTFAKRVVQLGRQVGRMAPVLSGLKEGEGFVASGSFILKADLGKSNAQGD